MASSQQKTILVSSAVYGFEPLLEQLYGVLHTLGYEVWMSYKGTLPIDPEKTALESCLKAVRECDLYLGIILPRYGSGKEKKDSDSITHEELKLAIKLNKPRWILAHDHVFFTRSLLNKLGYKDSKKRATLTLEKNDILQDLRVVDMLELAMRHDTKEYQDRKGNWVQPFVDQDDTNLFAIGQFHRYAEAIKFAEEQLSNPPEPKGKPS